VNALIGEHERPPVVDRGGRRETATRIERQYPAWLVMWSPYYLEYYAYPRFYVPQGTVLHNSDPGQLAAEMRTVQKAAAQASRVAAASAGGGMWRG
jgi:hypothetical protein